MAEAKEIHWICVEDERQRHCWLSGLRLAKYGQQLRENYREAERRERRELRSQSRGRQYTYPSVASPVVRFLFAFFFLHFVNDFDRNRKQISLAREVIFSNG